MLLCFRLTMPDIGSWNGKWRGQGVLYAKIKAIGYSNKAKERGFTLIKDSPYSYHWDDGWTASIHVSEVDAQEARKIRAASRGFYGYEWMIASILADGEIKTSSGD